MTKDEALKQLKTRCDYYKEQQASDENDYHNPYEVWEELETLLDSALKYNTEEYNYWEDIISDISDEYFDR